MRLAGVTASTMLLLAALATPCYAQFRIGAGMERYVSSVDASQMDERGWRRAAWLQYVQNDPNGWLVGYVGKVYTGKVNFTEGDPAAPILVDKTEYRGVSNELQLRFREASDLKRRLDGIIGVGLDRWREEQVTTAAKQDVQVGFLRFGFESDTTESHGVAYGAGVRLPIVNRVNLHLDTAGFDTNPLFQPRARLSFYGQVGYRMGGAFNIVAYVDSYRFDDSPAVELFQGGVSQGYYYLPPRDIWMYGLRLELGTW